jgi:hypothetical protein
MKNFTESMEELTEARDQLLEALAHRLGIYWLMQKLTDLFVGFENFKRTNRLMSRWHQGENDE